MTLNITAFSITMRKCDPLHNDIQCLCQLSVAIVLSVIMLSLHANIRLGWKGSQGRNPLAFLNTRKLRA
jgi:hypothetical protein